MGRRGRPVVWNAQDLIVQEMYGLSEFWTGNCKPKFGSSILLLLNVGRFGVTQRIEFGDHGELHIVQEGKGEPERVPPTRLNLAWHFGYMDWAIQNVANLTRQTKGKITFADLDERFFLAAQGYATAHFESEMVVSLRRALLDCGCPLYFYCVPRNVFITDLVTGKLVIQEEDQVLCILPKSPAVARHYSLSEEEIKLLAPQVGWLIRSRCSHHGIKTSRELRADIGEWVHYLTGPVWEKMIGLIARSQPQLIPSGGAPALLAELRT